MNSEFWKWAKDIWRRVPKAAVIILLVLIATGICADFLALHDPEIGDPGSGCCRPPGKPAGKSTYPLGTIRWAGCA